MSTQQKSSESREWEAQIGARIPILVTAERNSQFTNETAQAPAANLRANKVGDEPVLRELLLHLPHQTTTNTCSQQP